MRPAALAAGALALALALTGCETTAEKSARLERAALRSAGARAASTATTATTRPSASVHVRDAVVVHASEGSAVMLTLRNDSGRALANLPIAIDVKDAKGAVVYSNTARGFARSLLLAPLVPAHGHATWVDDQVSAREAASVSAKVGEGSPVAGATPAIATRDVRLVEDPANGVGAEGTVANRSAVAQRELVVDVVARKGGRAVAVGRAVLTELAAGASASFQAFFVGDPRGAQLHVTAQPTTLR